MDSRQFFSGRKAVFLLATLCCLLWGSAYPAIKNGYAMFAIAADDIPGKLVFAGWRFLFAGWVLLLLARLMNKQIFAFSRRDLGALTLLGLTQTTLQYVFFYVGLAYTTGVKGSILNATGTFFSVLLAHFIYHNDRLSYRKVIGCSVGFAGVMVVNLAGGATGFDFEFTLLGEGFIVIAAFVLSAATIYGKRLSQKMDSMVMTGHQLAIGGAVLLLMGYGSGGTLQGFTLASTALLAYMVVLSSAAFAVWATLLKYNRVGMVTVFNFLIPVFGALLSALFLGEDILEWRNALALVMVSAGIWWVTTERTNLTSTAIPSAPATRPARNGRAD
jgi:drug/metabolite transporter (DMT)-like permease